MMNIEPLNFVVERVFDLLKHEANILLVDEKELLQSLQEEMELIESYLKDMDEVQQKATLSNVLKTKVNHLMKIVPELEDFLDNLIHQKEQQPQRSRRSRVKVFFSRTSNPLFRKHHLVEKVKQIRENLRDTLKRQQGFELPSNFPQVTTRRRIPTDSCILTDEIIVGLEEDVSTLVAKFIGKDGESAVNSAIVGMGGSGKTTLAKKFYNHEEIKEAFPRRAWVCVSQEWDANDLLLKICAMLGIQLSDDELRIPRVKFQKFLHEEGSCLVVLDDVWKKEALQELLPTLLAGNGKVLITTRKEKIVKFPRIGPFYIHRARRLTPEQSWELFSRIFRNSCDGVINFEDDDDYTRLGKEMLEKCDGLPLAIITLAGLLVTKATIQQWESIKDRVISMIMRDDDEAVDKVLELSYFDLPYSIKPCFLYLGTFREDAVIDAKELINLWVDEGFIETDQCAEYKRLEEVAMDFLEELVQRCMLQVVSRDYDGLYVRVHDLMHDLCIYKAKELKFFQVWSSSTTLFEIKPPYHRAIIYDRDTLVFNNPRLRTLRWSMNSLPKELLPFEKLKQLRVLSLSDVELGDSTKHIGNMHLLRYLKLWFCEYKIENLDFIRNLRNLQTFLLATYKSLPKLSDNIVGSMEHLRVFNLRLSKNDVNTSLSLLGVSNSRNLQILNAPGGQWIVKELSAISIHLKELYLYHISRQAELDVVQGCVGNTFIHLEALTLSLSPVERESELGFDLEEMKLGRCQLLKRVHLNGKITKQNGQLLFPAKLLSLYLEKSEIDEEVNMKKAIARLDHLRELFLGERSYTGVKLTIIGLPQLQKLSLDSLGNIKEFEIVAGALPQLRQLRIMHCKELERVPNGISNIHTLQLLRVLLMPETFSKRLKKREDRASDGGEDFHLVKHIPNIHLHDKYMRM